MKRFKNTKKILNFILGMILVISVSGNIVLASSYGAAKKNEKRLSETVKEIEKDYDEFQEKKDQKMDAVCDLYYESKVKKLLDEDEINYLAFMAWEYKIAVNGIEIKSPIIETRSDVVRISFTEKMISDLLPSNILKSGRFILDDENLKDYMKVEFKTDPKPFVSDENGNRIITYTFRNVEVGDVITVRLSEEIIERLMLYEKINLQDNKLEIIRNR